MNQNKVNINIISLSDSNTNIIINNTSNIIQNISIPSYKNKSIIIPDLSTNFISLEKIENMDIFCDIMVLGNSIINQNFTSDNYLTIPNSMNQF